MTRIFTILIVVLLAYAAFGAMTNRNTEIPINGETESSETQNTAVEVTPISHATMMLTWGETVMYVDPTGGALPFVSLPPPDIIFVTDIHGDHLSIETLEAVTAPDTTIIAPQAVVDEFSEILISKSLVLGNNEKIELGGFFVEGMPMYNLDDQGVEIRHVKGRGNGYLIEKDRERVYIAGDTADIPEMRMLRNIDIAFIPMNLPYTMDVERAADAVVEFAPAVVYPYHYRTPNGLSDVDRFKTLVNEGNSEVEVILLDWYSE